MSLNLETTSEVAAAKVRRIDLKRITLCDDMQPRLVISEDAIRRYKDALRQNPDSLPPVLLADLGEDQHGKGSNERMLTVVDGWHRFKAHEELRREKIKARVIQCSPERGRWLAALANLEHGLPLKRGDHRRVFRRYIQAGENRNPDGSPRSYRDIVGDLSGLRALGTIHKWMQKDFPSIAAEMAKSGEEVEPEAPKESTSSYAQIQMKSFALGLVRMAKVAVKEDKEDIKGDILEWSLFLTENLGRTIGIEPKDLFEAAQEAEWQSRRELEDESL